jgi:hypothetical protein
LILADSGLARFRSVGCPGIKVCVRLEAAAVVVKEIGVGE